MICTSIPLRTSTRVSPGFILVLDRSPPLGYTLCRSTALSPKARGLGSEGRVAGLSAPPARVRGKAGLSVPSHVVYLQGRLDNLLSLRV